MNTPGGRRHHYLSRSRAAAAALARAAADALVVAAAAAAAIAAGAAAAAAATAAAHATHLSAEKRCMHARLMHCSQPLQYCSRFVQCQNVLLRLLQSVRRDSQLHELCRSGALTILGSSRKSQSPVTEIICRLVSEMGVGSCGKTRCAPRRPPRTRRCSVAARVCVSESGLSYFGLNSGQALGTESI